MKVTIIKNGPKGRTVSSLTIEELVESIRSCSYSQALEDYRERLIVESINNGEVSDSASRLIPSVCFAAA